MVSRSILVTGGNRGIGLATARAFADAGDRVAVTYRTGDVPEGLFGVRCDVTSPEQVDAAFTTIEQEHGPVEVLVSNAGATRDGLIMRMPEDDFAAIVDTNLGGAFRVAKRASKHMVRAHAGRMIFVSSVAAFTGEAGQSNYAAAKAGLLGLARSLARELGSRNITVNVIAPGFTETDMTAKLTDAQRAGWIDRIPLRRPASPDEIAAAIVFLASPQASYITGAVIPVDGGGAMGL